ncbi:MAG: hypothetical protein NZ480_05345 [Bdellovibrionaceae bacterium]|nr:hypothetical protein [Pseudobdellovibrionaceae bacterium]MDW8190398.1 hypothetical protein [Pseudobdellovibrionaceae bacterium]
MNKPQSSNFLTYLDLFRIASRYLAFETRRIQFIIFYTILVGILTVTASILIQFVVNEIAFTGQSYPLIILSGILVGTLLFNTTVQLIRKILVELIQQRILIRVTFAATDALTRLPLGKEETIRNHLVHRFFDVFSYQKSMTILLIDGVGTIIFSLVGSLIILFYHPILFLLNLIIIAGLLTIIHYFLQPALETNYQQSTAKYDLSQWLSELADQRSFFWSTQLRNVSINLADEKVSSYLMARKNHFRIVVWQAGWLYLLQAFGASLFLIFGGYLVLSGQMQLGQLVASESILVALLYNISQFSYTLDAGYDMVVASQKLDQLLDCYQNKEHRTYLHSSIKIKHPWQLKIGTYQNEKSIQIFHSGEIIFLEGFKQSDKHSFILDILGQSEAKPNFRITLEDIEISTISETWINENILFLDRPFRIGKELRKELLMYQPENSREEFPRILADIQRLWPETILNSPTIENNARLSLARLLFVPHKIIIIDQLLDFLSEQEMIFYLELAQKYLGEKIVICLSPSWFSWLQTINRYQNQITFNLNLNKIRELNYGYLEN